MKTYALATALALAVTSPAWAVQVEYRNADIAFAREIGSCFENAPEVLKTKTLSPRVIVVGDSAAMAKVQRETNAPKSDITKFANGFVAVAYRGVLGLQPRTLIFNQDTMKNSSPEYRCHVVTHEMAHLWDQGPAIKTSADRSSISHQSAFLAAFNTDKKFYNEWMAKEKKSNPKNAEMVGRRLGYYFSDPYEAFAEAVANHVAQLPNADYSGRNNDFAIVFENVNAYIQKLLTKNEIAWTALKVAEEEEEKPQQTQSQQFTPIPPTWKEYQKATGGKGFFISLPFIRLRLVLVRRIAVGPRVYHQSRRHTSPPPRIAQVQSKQPKQKQVVQTTTTKDSGSSGVINVK